MVPLPEAALRDLEQWWRWHRHPRLLFPAMGRSWKATLQRGQAERDRLQREQLHAAAHPMSDSALQNAWRMALAASGVDRRAHIHTLRNRFRTALKAAELIRSPPHGFLTPAGQLLRRGLSQPAPSGFGSSSTWHFPKRHGASRGMSMHAKSGAEREPSSM